MKRLLALVAVIALWGCTSDAPITPVDGPECADEAIAECRTNQMGCALDAADLPTCTACTTGEYADRAGRCTPMEGEVVQHDFPENSTEPGEEIRFLCRSWTLNNPEPIYVNAVELEQDELSHHSNWLFVPDDYFPGPDGVWPCAEREYSQLTAAVAGGVLYAQSTQAKREVQKFPDGVVVRLPPNVRIISDIHVLNTTSEPNTGHVRLSLYATPKAEVETVLTPFHLTYDGLFIPPQSTSRFSGECDLTEPYENINQSGVELDLYYLLPHTHALGTRMFVEAVGGTHDGVSLVDVRGFNSEARGKQFDPPIDLSTSNALRFGCEFENPRNEEVVWGFDDQEMCETLGFAASPIGFESRIEDAEELAPEGPIRRFTSTCDTIAFPFSSDI